MSAKVKIKIIGKLYLTGTAVRRTERSRLLILEKTLNIFGFLLFRKQNLCSVTCEDTEREEKSKEWYLLVSNASLQFQGPCLKH